MKRNFILAILVLGISLVWATDSMPGFRGLVRTRAEIFVAGQKRVVETLSSVAVKGNKYRVQMAQPTPQWFVCDGATIQTYNPGTGAKGTMKVSSFDQPGAAMNLFKRVTLGKGIDPVEEAWGLPPEVGFVKAVSESGKTSITLLSKTKRSVGTVTLNKTQDVGGHEMPKEILYKSSSDDPSINLTITYDSMALEENMPEETFTLGAEE